MGKSIKREVLNITKKGFDVYETTTYTDIRSCEECPYLTKGRNPGSDGRGAWTEYICQQGSFGKVQIDNYSAGFVSGGISLDTAIKGIHPDCIFLKDFKMEEELRKLSEKYGKEIGVISE